MNKIAPVLTVLRGGRLEIAPDQTGALVARAASRSLAGDQAGALADYALALDHARASLKELTDLNARQKAREFVARIHCDRAAAYMRIGIGGDRGGFDLALADCDEAVSMGHATPVMMSWQKSQILFSAGRYEEAAEVYRRALVLDPALKEMGSHALFRRTFAELGIPFETRNQEMEK